MRIMFLNAWGGAEAGFVPYIKRQATTTDILCFSEVHHALRLQDGTSRRVLPTQGKKSRTHLITLFNELQAALKDTHVGFHTPSMRGLHDLEGMPDDFFDYGLATFTRLAYRPQTIRTGMLHRPFGEYNDGKPASRAIVSMVVADKGRRVLIAHFHGLWDPRGKQLDTPERLVQSRRINEHLRTHQLAENFGERMPVVLGGDFNYTSVSRAFEILRNTKRLYGDTLPEVLNETWDIHDTRTHYYQGEIREADFVLASPALNAKLTLDYEAPSDHAALIVVF